MDLAACSKPLRSPLEADIGFHSIRGAALRPPQHHSHNAEEKMTDASVKGTSDEQAFWRSPLLGETRAVATEAGELPYFRRGQGRAIVFAHGWGVNANIWRNVVARLSGSYCCIALDLPFGAHRKPMKPDADLSPTKCGHLIAEALRGLHLEDVILVGNDSGGAYSQIALAHDSSRVSALVLNACETPYDSFPPPQFAALPIAAANLDILRAGYQRLTTREARSAPGAYGLLVKHPIDPQVSDSFALPPTRDENILLDLAKVMSSATSDPVHAAGKILIETFEKPVLFAWSREDPVFPLAHAERYASALKHATVQAVDDAYSFIAEDRPEWLSDVLAKFAASTAKR
jgi:pimeloyl-ACP methyl ester carboxylesterase